MDARRGGRDTARAALLLGVIGSMAGNVVWAVTIASPILVGVGVFMSLLLPMAVTLWRRTPVPHGVLRRIERAVVMTGICLVAAIYSLVHATLLLHDAGLPWSIAWAPSVGLELLVVMAARAGGFQSAGTRRPARDKHAKPSRQVTPASPSSPRAPSRPVPSRDTPVTPVSSSRPQLVPAPDTAAGDEPPVPGETDADKRRRQERNKKRRQRAKKAEQEQGTTTAEEGAV